MKLVEIKNVRIGQVWKRKDEYIALSCLGSCDIGGYPKEGVLYIKTQNGYYLLNDWDYFLSPKNEDFILCGKLGITHELKYGKLVEIPRADFENDDIVHFSLFSGQFIGEGVVVTSNSDVERERGWIRVFTGLGFYLVRPSDERKKIGIYGVTHEFVNERDGK